MEGRANFSSPDTSSVGDHQLAEVIEDLTVGMIYEVTEPQMKRSYGGK